jgi:hypothetical protein
MFSDPFLTRDGGTGTADGPEVGRPAWTVWILTTLFACISAFQVYRLPLSAYVQDLNIDDSFYYYLVARNFARGLFSTADGIHLTNGYHPLWAGLLTPVFWLVQDPVAALRVAKMEELAILLIACALFAAAGRRAGWESAVLLALPVCLFSDLTYFRGLEVAAEVFVLAALLFVLTSVYRRPHKRSMWVALTLLCAVLPWVRLEAVTAAIATAALTPIYMQRLPGDYRKRCGALWAGTIGGLVMYLLYNQHFFGTVVPVSGQIKSYWSAARFSQIGGHHPLRDAIAYFMRERRLVAATLACLLLVAFSWSKPRYRKATYRVNHAVDVFFLSLACFFASRLLYSICFLHIDYDEPWYYVPGMLLLVLSAPLVVSRVFLLVRLTSDSVTYVGIKETATALAVLLLVVAMVEPFQEFGAWRRGWRSNWQAASFDGTQWMNEHLPKGSVIGSSDSGIVAYFSKYPVVNLDGLVNSRQFLSAVRGQAVEAWIKQEDIHYLANSMWTNMSGCRYMALASGQQKEYATPCYLIYEGDVEWTDRWAGTTVPMRFRVLADKPQQRAGETTTPSDLRAISSFGTR